ncbi:MAG: hypothetical protein R3Y64_06645 [Peptostreptococcaceae bacterium]
MAKNEYEKFDAIYEAVKLNNKESAINLTKEMLENQTDKNRIKNLEKLLNNLI